MKLIMFNRLTIIVNKPLNTNNTQLAIFNKLLNSTIKQTIKHTKTNY